MASFALSATTGGARKLTWTKRQNKPECFSERLGDYWLFYIDMGLRTWNFVRGGGRFVRRPCFFGIFQIVGLR